MADGDEPERRLKKVMDKLYHFPSPPKPKSKPSPPSSSSSPGKEAARRAELSTRFGMEKVMRVPNVAAVVSPAPPCRPWDRGDLMRRLATFKAMTWFAKPKVIGPVNCARRGWINVELDTISCEACGARLMFSSPTSWTSQQVDKAAAVFSLKLDSGHKLLCPWIDNTCEESLALFPPTPSSVLIRNYEDCTADLLQLSSLPKISSLAVSYMKKLDSRVEEFLRELSQYSVMIKRTIKITEGVNGKELGDIVDDSNAYYEALKLIALCGWGLHQLPYTIDRAKPISHIYNTTLPQSTQQEPSCLVTSNPTAENISAESKYHDLSSYILDCNLCGARAALWPFSTVEKPLKVFSFEAASSSACQENINENSGGCNNNMGKGLSISIGGGPPATRQNFRPKVTLPIVSRHLKLVLQSPGGMKRKRNRDGDEISEKEGSEATTDGLSEDMSGKHVLFDKLDEFNPIRQHRTFCPWICGDINNNNQILPGWKLMLSALLAQKENMSNDDYSPHEKKNLEKKPSLLDEEDDPVASVRRLFMVTPSKRLKTAP